MRRILMVLEDFNELLYLQTLLKKVGFDVEGVNQAKKFDDILLAFNPQVILITPKVGKSSAVDLLSQIGKVNSFPRIGLLHNAKAHIDEPSLKSAGIDFFVNAPVNVHSLVEQLADELALDRDSLLDKLKRLDNRKEEPEEEEEAEEEAEGDTNEEENEDEKEEEADTEEEEPEEKEEEEAEAEDKEEDKEKDEDEDEDERRHL